jgi:glycosyltransferase involved in cell wall biosynthesis
MGHEVHSVAVVALHPIQYQVGLWREMARHPRLRVRVFYLDRMGIDGTRDPTLDVPLDWDMPMLDGYDHEFVPNLSPARFTPIVNRINPTLLARLVAGRFDAVMVHGWHSVSNWLALLASRLTGSAIVYRGEGTLVGKFDPLPPVLEFPKLALNKLFLRGTDLVAYSSSDNRSYHVSRGARDATLFSMPCAIDNVLLESYRRQAASRVEFRARLGLPPNANLVLSAGRFTERKRFEDLIRAIAAIPDPNGDTHLIIAGNGAEGTADRIRHEAAAVGLSARVHLLGWLSPAKMVEALRAADVFVMASSHDPSPKAMSEALAVGLPIVCSDKVGTCADLVQHGRNGYAYHCGDVAELSRWLQALLAAPHQRERMASESILIAKANDFRAATERLVEALDAHVQRVVG